MLNRRATAEALGTFVLVFGGVGSAVIAGKAIGALGVAFAFGISLLAMAYAVGPISGCHINPAVTLGMLSVKKITLEEAIRYWIAQCVGAILAALVLFVVIKSRAGGYVLHEEGFGANGFGSHSPDGYPIGGAVIVEIVLTGLLIFTVLAATDRIANVAFAGIPIGLVLTLIHLVGIPVDNLSVNPARSLGPALFVGHWALVQLPIFLVSPMIGALGGAALYRYVFDDATAIPATESAVEADVGPATPRTA